MDNVYSVKGDAQEKAVVQTMKMELERKLEYVRESQGKELKSLTVIQEIMEQVVHQTSTQTMKLESQGGKLESVRQSQASQEKKIESLQTMLQKLLDRGKEASDS